MYFLREPPWQRHPTPKSYPMRLASRLLAGILFCWSARGLCQEGPVHVSEIPAQGRNQLARMLALASKGVWEEALDALAALSQLYGDTLILLPDSTRWVPVSEYLDALVVTWPAPGIDAYRQRFDREAAEAFEAAIQLGDAAALEDVARNYFPASTTDDVLWKLGEMRAERGEFLNARAAWRRLLPLGVAFPGDTGKEAAASIRVPARYPQGDVPLADVLARLVWLSLMEGDLERATVELADFRSRFPEAVGRMGSRDVPYASYLESLLQESRTVPRRPRTSQRGWPTAGGDSQRGRVSGELVDVGGEYWAVPWQTPVLSVPSIARGGGGPPHGKSAEPLLLGCYPIWVPRNGRDLVFVANEREVLAWDLHTGQPAWGDTPVVFRSQEETVLPVPDQALGSPCHTLTACGRLLFAVMGPQVTNGPGDGGRVGSGQLVCLDIDAQGKLLWQFPCADERLVFESEGWRIDGTPLADGWQVYGMMRRGGVRPECHVACWEAATGRLRWRRFVCAASAAGAPAWERSHRLLALCDGWVYAGTDLGAVAAIDAKTGRIRWLTTYPRKGASTPGLSMAQAVAQPGGCVVADGRVFLAPGDAEQVLALDAVTGEILWTREIFAGAAAQPLGVARHTLILGTNQLWGLDSENGQVRWIWPGRDAKMGFGRGILVDDAVYWPSSWRQIDVVDVATGFPRSPPIELGPRGLTAGNLLATNSRLVIAGRDRLFGVSRYARLAREPRREQEPAGGAN